MEVELTDYPPKLFIRVGNSIKLTEGGNILFDSVILFLNDLDNLKRISTDIVNSRRGRLTLVANNAILMYVLPDVIKRFRKEFPGFTIKLITRNLTAELLPLVSNGEVDLAMGAVEDRPFSPKLHLLPWKSFNRMLIVPNDHPLSKKKVIELSDISPYPLILLKEGSPIRIAVEDALIQSRLPYEITIETDATESLKIYVELGLGISIINSVMLTSKDIGRFCVFNVAHLFREVTYGIYYRKDKYVTTSMKEFVKCLAPELCDNFD
jgi:LysR family cys regulon transcriptional activator